MVVVRVRMVVCVVVKVVVRIVIRSTDIKLSRVPFTTEIYFLTSILEIYSRLSLSQFHDKGFQNLSIPNRVKFVGVRQ